MSALTVDVNPNILAWARKELGFELSEVADKLKKETTILEAWEADGRDVRYSDLTKIAKLYKRQIPVFFLKDTPSEVKKPKDYRNLSLKSKGLHQDTMLAIRRTSRYLELYRESTPVSQIDEQYKWLDEVKSSIQKPELILRDILDVPISEQKKNKNKKLSFWRNRIEDKLNIFVFQFPIENGEFDGFSYIEDGRPFAITLNSKITEKRKIFTLFHELGHILEGQAGICVTHGTDMSHQVEARCNKFAANFLMPASEVARPDTFDELRAHADELGVSMEAYLIRTQTLKLISDADFKTYKAMIHAINAKFKNEPKTKKDGFAPPQVLSKSQRGDKFFDFVINAYSNNVLSASAVRDILNVKVAGLGK